MSHLGGIAASIPFIENLALSHAIGICKSGKKRLLNISFSARRDLTKEVVTHIKKGKRCE